MTPQSHVALMSQDCQKNSGLYWQSHEVPELFSPIVVHLFVLAAEPSFKGDLREELILQNRDEESSSDGNGSGEPQSPSAPLFHLPACLPWCPMHGITWTRGTVGLNSGSLIFWVLGR